MPTANEIRVAAEAAAEHGRGFVCLSHSPFMTLPGLECAGSGYRAAVEDVRQFIDGFDPDVVVLFAPDHMNLLMQIRPPFTGVLSGVTIPEFGIPELALNVHPCAAEVYAGVVRDDVDLAVGENVAVDHGLGLTLMQLFDRPAQIPLVPVIVNAIGFPLFPLLRADRVGAAFGRAFQERSERVLFVGTGGLSHNPPFPDPAPGARRLSAEERAESLRAAPQYLDEAWDRALLDGMAAGRPGALTDVTQADLDRRGGGVNEIRTWAATWAAAGHAPAAFSSYEAVPEWITGMGVAFGAAVPLPADPSSQLARSGAV